MVMNKMATFILQIRISVTNHHQKYIQGMDTCEQNTLINVAHLRGCFITKNPAKLIMEAPKNEALQKNDFRSFCWKGVILRKPIFLVFFCDYEPGDLLNMDTKT